MNAVPAPWRRGLFVVLVAGFAVAGCDSIPIDYFDPDAEEYVVLRSDPIPITVKESTRSLSPCTTH